MKSRYSTVGLIGVAHAIIIVLVSKRSSALSPSPGQNTSSGCSPAQSAPDFSCKERLACPGDDACPPGLFCQSGYCRCGYYPNRFMTCNGTDAFIIKNNCVTFDEERHIVSVGSCLHHSAKSGTGPGQNLYNTLPRNRCELDEMMCNPAKRTGTLCGRCLPDHYPLAYSYSMTCIRCPHVRWDWAKYIMAAYLPLTLFYFLILFFKVNTTSSHLFPLVYFCQTVSCPLLMRMLISVVAYDEELNSSYVSAIKFFFSLFGIWNLDFFRIYYSSLCLRIGLLPTLALDYAIAVYPLLLMIISYLLIVLYDRNYRIVTIMWSPFRAIFTLFRRNWDIKTSIIDVFASFFFFTNVKLLSVSFDLLIPNQVYHLHPDNYSYSLALNYAGDIKYFGTEHLPYAILALAVLSVFVLMPLITLAFYPFAFFQNFLNLFPFRWYILHTFVDSFYGCYKDGTQPGTRDYRWFASTFFGIRIIQFLTYSLSDTTIALELCAITIFMQACMVAVFRPFRNFEVDYNTTNFLHLQFSALFAGTVLTINFCIYMAPQYVQLFYALAIVFIVVPLLCGLVTTLYWLCHRTKFEVRMMQRFKAWRSGYTRIPGAVNSPLPDRMENSGEYPRGNLANFISTEQ